MARVDGRARFEIVCRLVEAALSTGPKVRLLQDITARKCYELPSYTGPADRDVLLADLIERIRKEDPAWSHDDERIPIDQQPHAHRGNLMVIEREVWDKRKKEILAEMWRDFGMSDEDVMSTYRNTYAEDANVCFNRHGRPDAGCIDYKEDHKRIGNPTEGGRGLRQALAHIAPVYLCDFCPAKSWYQTKAFTERGYYDK